MTEEITLEIINNAMNDSTAIMTTIISSGIVTVLITTITALIQYKTNKRDTLSTEYRQKKDKALDELLNDFNSLNNLELTSNSEIALIPRQECSARELNNVFIPISMMFLEDIDKLNEYKNNVALIISKHQFWFSDKLSQAFHYYVSYLDNLFYLCKLNIIKPNKLLSVLLSMDFYNMQLWINKELNNCYFGKQKTKYIPIMNKKYVKKFIQLNKRHALGSLVLMTANDEMKEKYKKVKYTESNFYKHYTLCMACKLNCPLAKQDFICADKTKKKKAVNS